MGAFGPPLVSFTRMAFPTFCVGSLGLGIFILNPSYEEAERICSHHHVEPEAAHLEGGCDGVGGAAFRREGGCLLEDAVEGHDVRLRVNCGGL